MFVCSMACGRLLHSQVLVDHGNSINPWPGGACCCLPVHCHMAMLPGIVMQSCRASFGGRGQTHAEGPQVCLWMRHTGFRVQGLGFRV